MYNDKLDEVDVPDHASGRIAKFKEDRCTIDVLGGSPQFSKWLITMVSTRFFRVTFLGVLSDLFGG